MGLFWRSGFRLTVRPENIVQERAIICICWQWEDDETVYKATWNDGDDRELCETFAQVLWKAGEAIAHNGDRFDVKWFRTRCLYHDIKLPIELTTLDTLKKVKKYFYLNSNRLDYISKFLGFEGKSESNWGMWEEVTLHAMATRMGLNPGSCQETLDEMVGYCQEDVRQLRKVFDRIKNHIDHNTHRGVQQGEEKFSCPECASNNIHCFNTRTTKAGMKKRQMKCKDCHKSYSISNRSYMKLLEWRLEQKTKI